jgi:hypothetical protein
MIINRELPDTLVIPTFGNNDFDLDDEPANETVKKEFYTRIFNAWFRNHPVNKRVMNLPEVWNTFIHGGYYRVDLSPTTSVLALNTVMYIFKNRGVPS